MRLETLGTLVTLSAALFAIIDTSLSSGLVGLSVTYAMNVRNPSQGLYISGLLVGLSRRGCWVVQWIKPLLVTAVVRT